MKFDLAAGLPARGALGVITANAGSVQRLNDPFEHLVRHRKLEQRRAAVAEKRATRLENASKQAENGVVHEAQMRGGRFGRNEPYRKIPVFRTDLEEDQWFREQKTSPDYHADPWLNGKTEQLGRELLPIARARVRKRYYESHMNHVFSKGQEPTEYELITDTYEAKEFEKKWLL